MSEIVFFETKDREVKLPVAVDRNDVWLNRQQMADLFDRDIKTIGKHINNALKEELADQVVVAKFATTTQHGAIEGKTQTHLTEFYNLDMIISVGYRVKSQRGVEFRHWANSVLKQYIMDGYVVNEKRLLALQKTVEIQTKMLANTMEVESEEVLKAVNLYTEALQLLDQYDHQSLEKPEGSVPVYRITYDDCRIRSERKRYHDNDGYESFEGRRKSNDIKELGDAKSRVYRSRLEIISKKTPGMAGTLYGRAD